MKHLTNSNSTQVSAIQIRPRVAVVGAGIAGLTCARELSLRGYVPVVFEASDRLGGRCSSRSTRVGLFDDGAQYISGPTRLAALAVPGTGELATLHPWTMPASPAENERDGKESLKDAMKDDDEPDVAPTLKLMGAVGVPSMMALSSALARYMDVRLHTPIQQAQRRGGRWILTSAAGEIDEDFQALVLAIPAPLAMPLVCESAVLSDALSEVQYASRWVLLLGTERPVPLPGYRAFQGSPIERVAAMHTKPGRSTSGPQRWFVEADQRWSLQHEHDDAESVADLLLDNFRAHAIRAVAPNYLCAQQWRHAFVQTPAVTPRRSECLWDDERRLGVCGDSVVTSRVDRAHHSGASMARTLIDALSPRTRYHLFAGTVEQRRSRRLEAQL